MKTNYQKIEWIKAKLKELEELEQDKTNCVLEVAKIEALTNEIGEAIREESASTGEYVQREDRIFKKVMSLVNHK